MHGMLPLLRTTDFPAIARKATDTLQVNLGYKCNQACFHCHVNASPERKEMMSRETVDEIVSVLQTGRFTTLDITGGAPELNAHFRHLVVKARGLELRVIDRCNLTVLLESGQESLAEFLAANQVEITASLPCYSEKNVDAQRGAHVFEKSIQALRLLNALGYGTNGSGLVLNLVYNPLGPSLPPAQDALEEAYTRELSNNFGVVFNRLLTLANMPINRFGSTLVSKGQFSGYMELLRSSHNAANLEHVMCRTLISVDYRGYLYDCDFNQMLGIPLSIAGKPRLHVSALRQQALQSNPIAIADHCYGCTAGQGSSCGGAL